MPVDFPDRIFEFDVEQRIIPRPGGAAFRPVGRTQIGVLHTTENLSIEEAFRKLNRDHSAPHFIVGENRIIQCRSLTHQAAALVGDAPCLANANAAVQIEMVAFTGGGRNDSTTTNLWIPRDDVLLPTVAIMAFCAGNGIDIPLQVPTEDWQDDASDMPLPWAGGPTPRNPGGRMNARRRRAATGDFPRLKGWWMHVEIPCQGPNWHHDCGRLRRRDMLRMARLLQP